MTFSVVVGIKDNDPKGKTGVGTIFYADIQHDGTTDRIEWSLVDQVKGVFNLDNVLKPYKDQQTKAQAAVAAKEAEEKKHRMAQREAGIAVDPKLTTIIQGVVAGDAKAVAEFKSGKERALNALVGKVMGQAKKEGLAPDAFAVNRLIQQHIGA